jgi:hypothetical protein
MDGEEEETDPEFSGEVDDDPPDGTGPKADLGRRA